MAIDTQRWDLDQKLRVRLHDLRDKYGIQDRNCICNLEALELQGEDNEYTSFPGDEGDYLDYYCLRCGGYQDHT
jgi:hypothetical protein